MSRSRTRARNRRARLEEARAQLRAYREDPEAWAALVGRLAGSDLRVWAAARVCHICGADRGLV